MLREVLISASPAPQGRLARQFNDSVLRAFGGVWSRRRLDYPSNSGRPAVDAIGMHSVT